jgi:hypothetical protein
MIPKPKPHECVVFRDQFTAGLRMPCQDFIEEILKAYNIKIHHLTLNGIAKIVLFIWAVKSRRGNLDIVLFALFMKCIHNLGKRMLMAELLLSTLVVAVLSLLEVSNRFLQPQKINRLKIGIIIGFIIQFLLSKKEMTLERL